MPETQALDWTEILARADEPVEDVHRRLCMLGLVDGLPVVPATTARVRRLYREAGLDPTRFLAVLEPSMRPVTVYDAAVCATLAGCEPRHLPVVCAGLRAVAASVFNLLGIQTTTGTAAPVLIVNGAAARTAGVSGGADCLGGSTQANAAIGRALRLALRALGGAIPGQMDAATMGQPAKLGLCFAENEAASPWVPLHVERGFAAEAGVVTAVGVSGTVEVVYGESGPAEEILETMAGSMTIAGTLGSRGLLGSGHPLVIFSPEHARALTDAGVDKPAVKHRLWEIAALSLDRVPGALATRIRSARRDSGGDPEAPVRVAERPEDILVVVAGGTGVKSTYLPGWGGGTQPISVPVDRW